MTAYRANKDAGYNIFYMGINIGAFVCNFVAAYMQIKYGWGYAFAAAGIGMLIGVVVFTAGNKHVKEADVIKPLQPGDMSTGKILMSTIVLPMFVFGILGYLIPGNLLGTDTNDAFIFGCIPVHRLLHLPVCRGPTKRTNVRSVPCCSFRVLGDLLGGVPPERRCAHHLGQGPHGPRDARVATSERSLAEQVVNMAGRHRMTPTKAARGRPGA